MEYKTQAESADKYRSERYITPRRWSSYAIQVREVMLLKPKRVLEIGPGNNIVTDILRSIGHEVETLDIDSRTKPDHVGSITDEALIQKLSHKFDLILACEIFEHLRYEDFLKAIGLLKAALPVMVMSLPYTEINSKFFHFDLKIPGLNRIDRTMKVSYRPVEHEFNGEHYWEIGARSYPLARIAADIENSGWKIRKRFLNPDNPYHYFFVLKNE